MLKNLSIVFFSDGLSKALNFLAMFYIIKMLSPSEYSYFTIALTVVFVGYQSACAVVERLYISDYENYKVNALHNSSFVISLVGAVFFFALLSKQGIEQSVLFLIGYYAFSLYQMKRIDYQRSQEFKKFSILEFLRVIIFSVGVFFLISIDHDSYQFYIVSLAASAIISYFLVFEYKNSRANRPVKETLIDVVAYFRRRIKLIVYSLLSSAFPYISILSIGLLGSEVEIASYGVATRFTTILGLAVYAMNVVTLPLISSQHLNDSLLMASELLKKSVWILVGFCIVSIVVGWVMKKTLAPQYDSAIFIFYILSVCSFSSFMSAPFVNVLLRKRRYDILLRGMLIGIIVFIGFLVVLRDVAGFYVSAYAASMSYLLLAAYLIYHGMDSNEDSDS